MPVNHPIIDVPIRTNYNVLILRAPMEVQIHSTTNLDLGEILYHSVTRAAM